MTSTLRQGVAVRTLYLSGRAIALAATLSLGACAQVGDVGLGSMLGGKEPEKDVAQTASSSELEKATAYWAKEAAKDPRNGKAAINYAKNLKALGRKPEALATLQAGYMFNAENRDFLSEYGRLALDAGQVNTAAQLLEQADDPAKPDWRVISARGTAMAKQGQYKESVTFFERARALAPGQASVLNNLAMAYTMDGQADRAEELLREAALLGKTDPRVQQNLAMVLSLQGKASDAAPVAGESDAPVVQIKASASSSGVSRPAAITAVEGNQLASASSGVTGTVVDPDEIIRAAMRAEAAKTAPPEQPTKPTKKKTSVASSEQAPTLKPAAR